MYPRPGGQPAAEFRRQLFEFDRTVSHFLQEASAGLCVRLRFVRGALLEKAARTTRDVSFLRSLQMHL